MNEGLFALSVVGTLSLDPVQLRVWYVDIVTKHPPQTVTHDV